MRDYDFGEPAETENEGPRSSALLPLVAAAALWRSGGLSVINKLSSGVMIPLFNGSVLRSGFEKRLKI